MLTKKAYDSIRRMTRHGEKALLRRLPLSLSLEISRFLAFVKRYMAEYEQTETRRKTSGVEEMERVKNNAK